MVPTFHVTSWQSSDRCGAMRRGPSNSSFHSDPRCRKKVTYPRPSPQRRSGSRESLVVDGCTTGQPRCPPAKRSCGHYGMVTPSEQSNILSRGMISWERYVDCFLIKRWHLDGPSAPGNVVTGDDELYQPITLNEICHRPVQIVGTGDCETLSTTAQEITTTHVHPDTDKRRSVPAMRNVTGQKFLHKCCQFPPES